MCRVTICYHRATVDPLRVTIGYLRANLGIFWVRTVWTKKRVISEKMGINSFKYIRKGHVMLGVFWKIQDICYQMGTEIFKIEEEEMSKKL